MKLNVNILPSHDNDWVYSRILTSYKLYWHYNVLAFAIYNFAEQWKLKFIRQADKPFSINFIFRDTHPCYMLFHIFFFVIISFLPQPQPPWLKVNDIERLIYTLSIMTFAYNRNSQAKTINNIFPKIFVHASKEILYSFGI